MTVEAAITMTFDNGTIAEAWIAACEEAGGKLNGELDHAEIEGESW